MTEKTLVLGFVFLIDHDSGDGAADGSEAAFTATDSRVAKDVQVGWFWVAKNLACVGQGNAHGL